MRKNKKTLIIAEIGVNHNGKLSIAKKLIKKAADVKADIVKFQMFKPQNLVTPHAKKASYQIGKKEKLLSKQIDMLKKFELNYEKFLKITKFCKKLKIEFCASCFDIESINLFKKLKTKRIKIPSGEITNFILLKKIAKLNKKIIMSTGMSSLSEINDAIKVLTTNGSNLKNITLLQCNSEYPSPFKDANLFAIKELKKIFKTKVGYSDHTPGIEASIAAVAIGATVIEKHLTLNKNLSGPDHKASIEPNEFKRLVNSVRNIEAALGSKEKGVTKSEKKNMIAVRKSIVAARKIFKGERFSLSNLDFKRPGSGISPMLVKKIVGKKANKNFKENEVIKN